MFIRSDEVAKVDGVESTALFNDKFVGVAAKGNLDIVAIDIERLSRTPHFARRVNASRSNANVQRAALGVTRKVTQMIMMVDWRAGYLLTEVIGLPTLESADPALADLRDPLYCTLAGRIRRVHDSRGESARP